MIIGATAAVIGAVIVAVYMPPGHLAPEEAGDLELPDPLVEAAVPQN